MTKREFLDTVFALAPNEANAIMDAFDEYVESNVVPTGRSGKERIMRYDYITRIIQVCLDIASIADEKGEQGEFVLPELGLGYRALSGILRRGCKDIIDLQGKYHAAIEGRSLAKIGEKTAYDFLEDIFGDREIDSINDKDKERIKAFVKQIYDEWELAEVEEGSEE